MQSIKGYCPMGCGSTLFVSSGGYVTCSWAHCPDPSRLADILLDDASPDHVVVLRADSFSMRHPLRERTEDLLSCTLHQYISDLNGPPRMPGRYRVESLSSDWASARWVPISEPKS